MKRHRAQMAKQNQTVAKVANSGGIGVFYVTLTMSSRKDNSHIQEEHIMRNAQSFHSHENLELADLLNHEPDHRAPRFLLYGAAGSGKSTVSQAIAFKWSLQEMWDEKFDLLFHLECRQLAADIKNRKQFSLIDLIVKHHCPDKLDGKKELGRYIDKKQKKVLLIIDGLDELPGWDAIASKQDAEIPHVTGINQIAEIPILIYNLIYGAFLENMPVLVTSRPIQFLKSTKFISIILALGFDEDAIDSCSFAVCQYDQTIHEELTTFLHDRSQLYAHCVIPLNCVLLSKIFFRNHKSKTARSIRSLSQLYIQIILDIVHKGNETSGTIENIPEDERASLRDLASLAAAGLLEGHKQIIFFDKDLENHNILKSKKVRRSNTSSGLLELHDNPGHIAGESIYTAAFLHLSMQEFLAAVHVCLNWNQKHVDHLSRVDSASSRYDNIQLFAAGLLGDKKVGHTFLQTLTSNTEASPMKGLVNWFFSTVGLTEDKSSFVQRTSDFVRCIRDMNGGINDMSKPGKLQLIRCVDEGRLDDVGTDVDNAVISTFKKGELDLGEISGGLLPHHLASISYFVDSSGNVEKLM